jgi:LysR family carnitine catabolism transcriptional activator
LEIRQIEYVVAVVDHGGFTRAAEALFVAQPSLSQGIRTLERELGVELFRRVGRRALLTAAGEAFLGPARQLLRDAAVIRASAAAVAGVAAGHLDLVALPTLAAEPLARLIGAFRVAHPSVTVRVAEPEAADEIVEMVRSGRCDLGLAELPVSGDDLESIPLLHQEIVAVCPPGTPLPRGGTLQVAKLGDMALVTTPPGTSTRRLVQQALASAHVEPVVAVETGQREAILPLVLAGAGTTFLPEAPAREAAARGAVVVRMSPPLRRTVGFVHRRGPISPAARAFMEIAGERLA